MLETGAHTHSTPSVSNTHKVVDPLQASSTSKRNDPVERMTPSRETGKLRPARIHPDSRAEISRSGMAMMPSSWRRTA